jgi:hypothetical protein
MEEEAEDGELVEAVGALAQLITALRAAVLGARSPPEALGVDALRSRLAGR